MKPSERHADELGLIKWFCFFASCVSAFCYGRTNETRFFWYAATTFLWPAVIWIAFFALDEFEEWLLEKTNYDEDEIQ